MGKTSLRRSVLRPDEASQRKSAIALTHCRQIAPPARSEHSPRRCAKDQTEEREPWRGDGGEGGMGGANAAGTGGSGGRLGDGRWSTRPQSPAKEATEEQARRAAIPARHMTLALSARAFAMAFASPPAPPARRGLRRRRPGFPRCLRARQPRRQAKRPPEPRPVRFRELVASRHAEPPSPGTASRTAPVHPP